MTFAFGFLCGIWATITVLILAFAAWYHRDQLIWGRVRAAEKAAPHNCDVIILHRSGAR